jgi:hypothetical protein
MGGGDAPCFVQYAIMCRFLLHRRGIFRWCQRSSVWDWRKMMVAFTQQSAGAVTVSFHVELQIMRPTPHSRMKDSDVARSSCPVIDWLLP